MKVLLSLLSQMLAARLEYLIRKEQVLINQPKSENEKVSRAAIEEEEGDDEEDDALARALCEVSQKRAAAAKAAAEEAVKVAAHKVAQQHRAGGTPRNFHRDHDSRGGYTPRPQAGPPQTRGPPPKFTGGQGGQQRKRSRSPGRR